MSKQLDSRVVLVYRRLWQYVTPHRLIGTIALVAMAATALIEMTLVAMVEPLMDEAENHWSSPARKNLSAALS